MVDPLDWNRILTIRIPRGVLFEGESGIVSTVFSCDVSSLYAPSDALKLPDTVPQGVIPNTPVLEVGLLVSSDNGENYFALGSLGAENAEISLSNVFPENRLNPSVYKHFSNYLHEENLLTLVPGPGDWDEINPRNTFCENGVLHFDSTALGNFILVQQAISPLSAQDGNFFMGMVPTYSAQTEVFAVRNTTEVTIQGQVLLEDTTGTFTVTKGKNFVIPPKTNLSLELTFRPNRIQEYTTKMTLISNVQAPVEIQLTGQGIQSKPFAIFGCGTLTAPGSRYGDILILSLLLLFLIRKQFIPKPEL
jgi:hypothetical protein